MARRPVPADKYHSLHTKDSAWTDPRPWGQKGTGSSDSLGTEAAQMAEYEARERREADTISSFKKVSMSMK